MIQLFDIVGEAYCINLDNRVDRWTQVTAQFKKIGIMDSVTRVSAVVDEDPRRGCLESHFHCIKDAMRKGAENILIFEDDVYFLNLDENVLAEVLGVLSRDKNWVHHNLAYFG